MRQIETILFNDKEIRRIREQGKTWFALIDLEKALGLTGCEARLKGYHARPEVKRACLVTEGGTERQTFLDESTFFRLMINAGFPLELRFLRAHLESALTNIDKAPKAAEKTKDRVWFFQRDLEEAEKIRPFTNNAFEIRRLKDPEGSSWYMARDMALILGYRNEEDMLDDHWISGGTKQITVKGEQAAEKLTVADERILFRLLVDSYIPDIPAIWEIKNRIYRNLLEIEPISSLEEKAHPHCQEGCHHSLPRDKTA